MVWFPIAPFTRAALVTGILCAASVCFAQTPEEKAGARAAANAGADAFDAGDFQEAIDMFQRAESVIHSPVHELYLARSMSQVGRLVEARELLLKIIRENNSAIAQEANQELDTLEGRVPKLTIKVAGQGAGALSISIDGKSFPAALVGVAQPFDPGDHEIHVSDGEREVTQSFAIEEGKEDTIDIDLSTGTAVPQIAPPPPPPEEEASGAEPVAVSTESASGASGLRIASYAAMGVGLAGIGVGTVFALSAGGHASDANSLCDDIDSREGTSNCSGRTSSEQSQVNDFEDKHKSAKTLSIIGFAAGGALVATGIALFIVSKPKSTESVRRKNLSVDPVVGLSYLGVQGSF